MSSILTNNGAMVALQTMRGINKGMQQVQSEISTGKSVGNARDNAAVWAISKTMESDVKGFKGISDSLALGSSTVAVGRQAAETVTDLLTEMKGLIVAAQEQNVDRGKIQTDIDALRDQIGSVVGAAQFNGLNTVNGSQSSPVSILSSLDRSGGGVTASNIDVFLSGTDLRTDAPIEDHDAAATLSAATLGAAAPLFSAVDFSQPDGTVGGAVAIAERNFDNGQGPADDALVAGDRIKLTLTQNNVEYNLLYTVSSGDTADSINEAFANQIAGLNLEGVSVDGEDITSTGTGVLEVGVEHTVERGGALGGLTDLTVNGTQGQRDAALRDIEGMIQYAIDAASNFGSAQKRIDIQAEFIQNLSDSLTTGIGSMIDADMEAASARLQALQVQQQLATQSLSIANQAPQNILALFR